MRTIQYLLALIAIILMINTMDGKPLFNDPDATFGDYLGRFMIVGMWILAVRSFGKELVSNKKKEDDLDDPMGLFIQQVFMMGYQQAVVNEVESVKKLADKYRKWCDEDAKHMKRLDKEIKELTEENERLKNKY